MHDTPRRPTLAALAVAALLARAATWPSAQSLAQAPDAPAGGSGAKAKAKTQEELKEARDKAREAAKEAREAVVAAKDEAREAVVAAKDEARAKLEAARADVKTAGAEVKAKLGEAREELRQNMHEGVDQLFGKPEDRAERARQHRRGEMHALRAHWRRGADIPPPVREALRQHARRTARLLRIRALAEAAKDKASIERCDKLLELERTHHQARMGRLVPKTAAPAAAPGGEADELEPDQKAAEEEGEEQP